jgi:quercetin dioxygenase-like cupin family protein
VPNLSFRAEEHESCRGYDTANRRGSFSLCLIPNALEADEQEVQVQQVLQTTGSWDGGEYQGYLVGRPRLTVLRIKMPPNTALLWHRHPVISVGYVLSGEVMLEKRETGERTVVLAGQAIAETVQTTRRAFTTSEPAELVVFYAGQVGMEINIGEVEVE